ncbi:UbiA prenyltransferase family [Suillus fuscotomentosus]|uniref:UbiA prenyltransferase family n=1 Tax=Suillus fuscotomentosus TaxID=1912939 RepID=A0AAD4DUJ3_9AGAM|nr:UbiA prenyltransferase family [Suillus fuscotomentosus]KAG1894188.1 UbiA prenyltransferase family [Suillus fuscotomentosus]
MLSQALESGRRISRHIMTLFLFTKSDVLTVLIPITLSTFAAAPHPDVTRVPDIIIWIWLHLLKHDIYNQMQDPEEDRKNKPYRPLPAGLITAQNAADVRWLLLPVCLIFSAMYGIKALACSAFLEALSIWYNEFGGDETGLLKNLLTTIAYATLELGATAVIGSSIDSIWVHAVAFSSVVFATTIHAQDFKDEEGDRLAGRRTLVTLFPDFARTSMMIGIPLWSLCLSRLWKVDLVSSIAFIAYGTIIGARFMVYRTAGAHKQSCKLYSLWYTLVHLLPGYWRFFNST